MNAQEKMTFHVTLMPSAETLLVVSHVLALQAILEMAAIAMVIVFHLICELCRDHIFFTPKMLMSVCWT